MLTILEYFKFALIRYSKIAVSNVIHAFAFYFVPDIPGDLFEALILALLNVEGRNIFLKRSFSFFPDTSETGDLFPAVDAVYRTS